MSFSFFRALFISTLFFYSFPGLSQTVDSVKYKGEWIYVYPFDRMVEYTYGWKNPNNDSRPRDLMIPMGALPDGKYVQFINLHGGFDPGLFYKLNTRLNKISKGRIPYAFFEVKHGKLNGTAYFFNVRGKLVETGGYENNFKEGIWHYGDDMRHYETYHLGVLNGKCARIYPADNKKDYYTIEEFWCVDGKMQQHSWESTRELDGRTVRYEEQPEDSITEQRNYVLYFNQQLVEEGTVTSRGDRTGTCKFYYTGSGKLKAELEFMPYRYNTNENEFYHFWARNLVFADGSQYNLELYGFGNKGVDHYYDDFYQPAFHWRYYRSPINANGTQYYENGQKMISYGSFNEEIYVDTLFHANGRPKYVALRDSLKGRYVAYYFDESGVKTYETFESWQKESVMYYKEYMLRESNNNDSLFYYLFRPKPDTLMSTGNGVVVTALAFNKKSLIRESYFNTGTRTRYTYKNLTGSYYPYTMETTEIFNEDFTSATVTSTTFFDNRYKSVTTYKVDYTAEDPFRTAAPNMLDMEQYEQMLQNSWDNLTFAEQMFPYTGATNFYESFYRYSNYETTYFLDEKPIDASVEIVYSYNKFKFKTKKDKIFIKAWSNDPLRLDFEHQLPHDRFTLQYNPGKLPLVPDLFAKVPGFYDYSDYRGFAGEFGLSETFRRLSKITGSFKNGKLHGAWNVYHQKHGVSAEMNFNQGIPEGQFRFYRLPWSGKKTLGQTVDFVNGKPVLVMIFNEFDDTLYKYYYDNGVPQKMEEYYYVLNYRAQRSEPPTRLTRIKTATFKNGVLTNVSVEVPLTDDPKTKSFACENDMLSGPLDLMGDSGVVVAGNFTGIHTVDGGHGKVEKIYVVNNLMQQEKLFSEDNNLLWEITYDTSMFKKPAPLNYLFRYFEITEYPYETYYFIEANETAEGYFKNYYDNGALQAEGSLIPGKNYDRRTGSWKYYNPSGQLVTSVQYTADSLIYEGLAIDSLRYNDHGRLTEYKNGQPLYHAHIISFMTRYNCMSDETYEVRILFVEEDILADGTTVKRPTRYHSNYYETGVLQSEGQLVNGLPHGLWKFYDTEGGLNAIGQFNNGRKEGVWFIGDLTGINFLGEFCLAPDPQGLSKSLDGLKRNLQIEMVTFKSDEVIREVKLNGYNNQNLAE